jgi:hypothetical protein
MIVLKYEKRKAHILTYKILKLDANILKAVFLTQTHTDHRLYYVQEITKHNEIYAQRKKLKSF